MLSETPKATLGKTGLKVSRVGFGSANIGYLDVSIEKVKQIVHAMLDNHVNLIDTAAAYPGSEEALGQTLGKRRKECILVSKCGQAASDLPGKAWSKQLIATTIDRSLKRLQTDCIDIMLLHSCSLDTLKQGEAMEALQQAKQAGKVGFIGFSGDNEGAAYAASLPEVDVIEMSVNIVDQINLENVLPICQEHNVGVLVKRPLGNAAWKELTLQPGMYSQYAEEYTNRLAAMDLEPEDLGFLGHAEVEWPEIALRFVLSFPGIHCAVVGTTSLTNAKANLAAAANGPLTDDVVQKIRDAFQRTEKPADKGWPGQT